MKLIGHNTKYKGWTIYLNERLGDITGQGSRFNTATKQVERTRYYEYDSVALNISIAAAAKLAVDAIKKEIDEQIQAALDALKPKKKK